MYMLTHSAFSSKCMKDRFFTRKHVKEMRKVKKPIPSRITASFTMVSSWNPNLAITAYQR